MKLNNTTTWVLGLAVCCACLDRTLPATQRGTGTLEQTGEDGGTTYAVAFNPWTDEKLCFEEGYDDCLDDGVCLADSHQCHGDSCEIATIGCFTTCREAWEGSFGDTSDEGRCDFEALRCDGDIGGCMASFPTLAKDDDKIEFEKRDFDTVKIKNSTGRKITFHILKPDIKALDEISKGDRKVKDSDIQKEVEIAADATETVRNVTFLQIKGKKIPLIHIAVTPKGTDTKTKPTKVEGATLELEVENR
jgi:hypothetical protein